MDELLTQTSLSPAKILTDIVCYDSLESLGKSLGKSVASGRRQVRAAKWIARRFTPVASYLGQGIDDQLDAMWRSLLVWSTNVWQQ